MFLFSCSCGDEPSKPREQKPSKPEYKISYYEGEKLIKEWEAYDYSMDGRYIKVYLDPKCSFHNRVYLSSGRVEVKSNQ